MLLQSVMEGEDGVGGCCCSSSADDVIFYVLSLNLSCYSWVLVIEVLRPVAIPDTLILSLLKVSLTVLVSVTGFFFTTTSSLTNGFLVISTSSLFNGTLISVLDFTG